MNPRLSPAELRTYEGMLHDFAVLPGLFDRATDGIDDACAFLRRTFVKEA